MRRLIFLLALFLCLIVPTVAQTETEWYRTQTGTGIGNCGPACVAMSINWSTEYDVTVESVRDYIGYTREDGATDYMELASAMRYWDVPYFIEIVQSLNGLKDLVDRKDLIAIVLIGTGGISIDTTSIFGRNYDFDGGHYIILTEVISNYFVVEDPMPGGIDRRYHVEEVWNSMRDHRVILIRNYDER